LASNLANREPSMGKTARADEVSAISSANRTGIGGLGLG